MHVGLPITESISRAKVYQALEEGCYLHVCSLFPVTASSFPFPRPSGGSEQVGLACRGSVSALLALPRPGITPVINSCGPLCYMCFPSASESRAQEGQEASAPVLGCGPITSGVTGQAASLSPSQP